MVTGKLEPLAKGKVLQLEPVVTAPLKPYAVEFSAKVSEDCAEQAPAPASTAETLLTDPLPADSADHAWAVSTTEPIARKPAVSFRVVGLVLTK